MTNLFLQNGDEVWLKRFQDVYAFALTITVITTVLINIFAGRVSRQTSLRIAAARERAEELARENLEIKKKMAWRTLEGEDLKFFVNSIQTPDHEHHVIVVRLQDGESWNYSGQILSAFTKATGWVRTESPKHLYGNGEVPQGLICRVSAHPDAIIEKTIKALEKANPSSLVRREQNFPPDTIEITVGLKPVG